MEPIAKTIPPMQNVTDIAAAAGGFHSLFLKSNTQVYACGFNGSASWATAATSTSSRRPAPARTRTAR